jgi:hypothetical protein
MKKILFLALVLAAACGLRAQQAPQFTMPIWFEDAIGNRDTLWVGSDVAASSREINPQFGEVELTAPFDSVFEVRGVHGDDPQWRTLKIVIEYTDSGGWCLLPPGTRIMIHALHWPVKISWDTMLLKQVAPCHENIILSPFITPSMLQYWYEAPVPIYCMMTREHVYESFGYEGHLFDLHLVKHDYMVAGQGMQVINGLYYTGFYDAPHCYTTLSDSPAQRLSGRLRIFPNPATDILQLDIEHPAEALSMSILDATSGKALLRRTEAGKGGWDISALPAGLYLLLVKMKDGSSFFQRFVKI